eukprot:scaffold44768_cov49-Cyclotella_meneghiniana.AAC.5
MKLNKAVEGVVMSVQDPAGSEITDLRGPERVSSEMLHLIIFQHTSYYSLAAFTKSSAKHTAMVLMFLKLASPPSPQ